MDRAYIKAGCLGCPHSRFVGGEPPAWRVQLCLRAVDLAGKHERAKAEVGDLLSLEFDTCPDEPRRLRVLGGI